jgi:hypothetical protein
MQRITLMAKGWGRSTLIHNAKEKTFETRRKNGMTKQVKSQAPAPRPTQDFKHAQCESKAMSKLMLENEWSCNLSLKCYPKANLIPSQQTI